MKTSSALVDRDFCLQKLDSAISLVKRLLDGDYPHRDSHEGLKKILEVYEADRLRLLSIDETAKQDTVLEFCRAVNINLVRFKIFLGLLLRSSNLRNAFELYFPIKILANELLEKRISVVLSSEWGFSPFIYPMVLPELPDFIFIGIPASESKNPLIMPLAGHELGHAVWRRKGVKQEFDGPLLAKILELYRKRWSEFSTRFNLGAVGPDRLEADLFLRGIWTKSFKLAQRQLEEVFCDYIALFIFGRAFLHSFRYLLAPSLGYDRSVNYPRLRSRAGYLEYLANQYEIGCPLNYSEAFSEREPALSPHDSFIVQVADLATEEMYPSLITLVDRYHGKAEKFDTGTSYEAAARTSLKSLVPIAKVRSMAAVVNAAWEIRLDLDDWPILTEISDDQRRRSDKLRVLRDLVLKSFEVYEFNKRLESHAP